MAWSHGFFCVAPALEVHLPMKFIDFITEILETQAKTLQRLAAFFGEEEFLEILEASGEMPSGEMTNRVLDFKLDPNWFEKPPASVTSTSYAQAYAQLEGTVHELGLPAVLEFHLWAYPFYRILIESSIDFKSPFRIAENKGVETLINEALAYAKLWVRNLPLHPELSAAAESAALLPWIRFHSEILKKIGKRPFISL